MDHYQPSPIAAIVDFVDSNANTFCARIPHIQPVGRFTSFPSLSFGVGGTSRLDITWKNLVEVDFVGRMFQFCLLTYCRVVRVVYRKDSTSFLARDLRK